MSTLTITDTDHILADYVLLPIQDLHQSFMFRVYTPIELNWQHSKVSLFKILLDQTSLLRAIEGEVIKSFKDALNEAAKNSGEALPPPMDRWSDLPIKLRECHITPKE